MRLAIAALLVGLGTALWTLAAVAGSLQILMPVQADGRGFDRSAERVAVVIGNAHYDNVPGLGNTLNDADAIAAALNRDGFEVFKAEDVSRREMLDAVEKFLLAVQPGAEALVYYAGHGVELDGQNYLLPTDIRDLNADQKLSLEDDAIGLNEILTHLEARSARVNLVLLDACRSNPFSSRDSRALGNAGGLGGIEPAQGTMVVYSAAAGETALDRLGAGDTDPNGVFTRSLLPLLSQPGLEIHDLVRELRTDVYTMAMREADHAQRPSYYDSLIGDFYFVPPGAAGAPGADTGQASSSLEPPQPASQVAVAAPPADTASSSVAPSPPQPLPQASSAAPQVVANIEPPAAPTAALDPAPAVPDTLPDTAHQLYTFDVTVERLPSDWLPIAEITQTAGLPRLPHQINETSSPRFGLMMIDGNFVVADNSLVDASVELRGTLFYPTGRAIRTGVRHTVELEVNWSPNADGLVRYWFDGEPVWQRTGRNITCALGTVPASKCAVALSTGADAIPSGARDPNETLIAQVGHVKRTIGRAQVAAALGGAKLTFPVVTQRRGGATPAVEILTSEVDSPSASLYNFTNMMVTRYSRLPDSDISYNIEGGFPNLADAHIQFVLAEALDKAAQARLRACPSIASQPGEVRPVIVLTRHDTAFVAEDLDCVAGKLPRTLATQARRLVSTFNQLAADMLRAGTLDTVENLGLRAWLQGVADGNLGVR